MIEGIIFDFDGTIVDSRGSLLGFYEDLFSRFEASQPHWRLTEVEKVVQGRSIPELLECYVTDERLRARMWEHVCGLDFVEVTVGLSLEPFVLEALADLRRSFPLALATNRTHAMEAVVRHFGLHPYIETVLTAADVESPKPSPDILLEAVARLRTDPAATVYVGDTGLDREAALRAGMPFLLYDRLNQAALHDLDDVPRVTDFRELRAALAALSAMP